MFGLLIVGALAPLGLLRLIPVEGWPQRTAWILAGVTAFMLVYALMLLPTRLVISDDGVWQKLLFSEWRLRWEEMAEWRYCASGVELEKGEMRERTMGRWHSNQFWVRDKAGKKYYFKGWLVFGRRAKQVAEVMRERGIEGG